MKFEGISSQLIVGIGHVTAIVKNQVGGTWARTHPCTRHGQQKGPMFLEDLVWIRGRVWFGVVKWFVEG